MASDSTADSTWEHLVTVTCDLMGRVAEPPSQYSTQEHLKSKLLFSSNAAQLVGAVHDATDNASTQREDMECLLCYSYFALASLFCGFCCPEYYALHKIRSIEFPSKENQWIKVT